MLYAFPKPQVSYGAIVFSRKLAMVAAAALHSSGGWWKPTAFPSTPAASKKRYRYRNFASYNHDDSHGSSITSTNKPKTNSSYQLYVKSPEEMVRVPQKLRFFLKKKNTSKCFILFF
jgi:hypothetical protein